MHPLLSPAPNAPLSILAARNPYPAIDLHKSETGCLTLVDGEVYNLRDLTSETGTYAMGPAAALSHLFRCNGPDALGSVDAAALIVHYDPQTENLSIARDRIGNAPVFYMEDGPDLIWSSDLPSLLPLIDSPEVNLAAVDFFMAGGYIPAPWSMVTGIYRVPPGHILTKRRGQPVQIRAYHTPTGNPTLTLSEDEIVDKLADLFPKAVARRIEDIDRTGVLLSAGVDSKTVLAAAVAVTGKAPKSFTFNYAGHDGDLNEASDAKACADYLGSEHHVIEFQPSDLPDLLPAIIHDFGEPFSYGLHTAILGVVKGYGVRDLLCGTGADGWFAGFQELNAIKYQQQNALVRLALRSATQVTLGAESALRGLGLGGRVPVASNLAHRLHTGIWTADTGLSFYLSDYIAPHWLRRRLYSTPQLADWGRREKEKLLRSVLSGLSGENLIARGKILSTRYYGADMMQNWNHWSARAIGATIRAPFYDFELMDLITRLPLDRQGKPELRKYASTMMPHDMAYTKKIAQSVPITDWFNGPLKDFVRDNLASGAFRTSNIFDGKAALNVWQNRPAYLVNIDWVFWNMIVLTQWQKQFGIATPHSLPG